MFAKPGREHAILACQVSRRKNGSSRGANLSTRPPHAPPYRIIIASSFATSSSYSTGTIVPSTPTRSLPLILILLLVGESVVLHAADRPSILLIYTDDQGYGDASCLNPDAKFQTPTSNRIAREGVIFTDGHCSDTVCTPSRYGLLTGRYSWRTELKRGVFGAERPCLIDDHRLTIASLARNHGYRTGMVGKWHLGMDFPGEWGDRDWTQPVRDMPLDKGFDYFWGIPASMNYGVLAWFDGRHTAVPPTRYTRKKDNRLAISDYRIMPPYQVEPKNPRDLEVAPDFVDVECLTRFTDKAVEWIAQQANDARTGTPFFLYVAYTSPHKPVIPVEAFRGKSNAGAYGDFMMETDWHVGRLLTALDEAGITEDTLVVFTSDNGPENTWSRRIELFDHYSAGPYREGKRSIYEGGHRVPFLVRYPARVAAGRRLDDPVCQTDILATVADLLTPSLLTTRPKIASASSRNYLGKKVRCATNRSSIIRHKVSCNSKRRLELVLPHRDKPMELYHLSEDPSETKNVLVNHQDVAKRLEQEITEIVVSGRTRPGDPVPNDTPYWDDLKWMTKEQYQR